MRRSRASQLHLRVLAWYCSVTGLRTRPRFDADFRRSSRYCTTSIGVICPKVLPARNASQPGRHNLHTSRSGFVRAERTRHLLQFSSVSSLSGEQIYYRVGKRVAPERDTAYECGASWYIDPETGEKGKAWDSTSEFTGNHVD